MKQYPPASTDRIGARAVVSSPVSPTRFYGPCAGETSQGPEKRALPEGVWRDPVSAQRFEDYVRVVCRHERGADVYDRVDPIVKDRYRRLALDELIAANARLPVPHPPTNREAR